MSTPTNRRLRVLGPTAGTGTVLLVDVESHETVSVPASDVPEAAVPGNVLEGTVERSDRDGGDSGDCRLRDSTIRERTLLEFADGVGNLFEAALDTWAEAREEGLAVNSRVTYDTGRNPAGALYTFAEQPGERDVFRELRDGALPLEPILDRAAESAPPPHEVFVLRPAAREFVLVYVVLEAGSVLADTVRDTYDCPRPSSADGAPVTD